MQAFDSVVLQGQYATGNGLTPGSATYIPPGPLFASNLVSVRGFPADFGLLCNGTAANPQYTLSPEQVVDVPSFTPLATPTLSAYASQLISFNNVDPSFTTGQFTLSYTPPPPAASPPPSSNIPWPTTTGTPAVPVTAANLASALAALVQTNLTPLVGGTLPANPVVSVTPISFANGIVTLQVGFTGAAAQTSGPIGIQSVSLLTSTNPAGTSVIVAAGPPARYVENTVTAIAQAYSILEAAGHYGDKAVVLYPYVYADINSPLAATLILPADRIKELMMEGIFATGSLPGIPNPISPPGPGPLAPVPNASNPQAQSMGVVVSIGTDTADLVIGQDPVIAFSQIDQNGYFIFRCVMRGLVRPKDITSFCRLEFL